MTKMLNTRAQLIVAFPNAICRNWYISVIVLLLFLQNLMHTQCSVFSDMKSTQLGKSTLT